MDARKLPNTSLILSENGGKLPQIPQYQTQGFFFPHLRINSALSKKRKKRKLGGREETVNPGVIFCLTKDSFRIKEQNILGRKKNKALQNSILEGWGKKLLTPSPFAGNKVKRNFPGYIFHRLPLLCLYACFPPLCILENNLNLFNGICSRRQSSPCTHFGAVSLLCSLEDFLWAWTIHCVEVPGFH